MLIGFSSMAGVIGGGGLGDLAIRYGYQRFNNEVMFGTVLILVAMVQGCKWPAIGWCAAWPTAASRQSLVPAALCRQLTNQTGGVTLADQPHPCPAQWAPYSWAPGLSRRRPALCRYHTPADNPARRSPDRLPQRTEGIRQTACRTPGYRGGQHRTPFKAVVDRRAVAGVGGRFRTQ